MYKLDAEKQMIKWIESMNCRPIAYIGFCADEKRRFKYQLGEWKKGSICYPLAEEGINENEILEWAKTVPLFNNWYKYFKRQGCMLCPMLTRKEIAYMCKYEHDSFERYFSYIGEYEKNFNTTLWGKPCNEIKKKIETKWVDILEMEENQLTIFDFIN